MNRQTISLTLIACAALSSVTACSWGGSRVDATYGDSVRSTVRAQLYDPATATNPSTEAVEGTDGQRMETVMEAHRGQAGSGEAVSNPIVINVGD